MNKKAYSRVPSWEVFNENYNSEYEESMDDVDSGKAEETDELDSDESNSEEESDKGIHAEIKEKILDIKDKLETSDDEFTKEDFLKFLDELTECCEEETDEDETGSEEGAGEGSTEEGGSAESDNLVEGKKNKGMKPKTTLPPTPKVLKHKKADVTGKVSTVKSTKK